MRECWASHRQCPVNQIERVSPATHSKVIYSPQQRETVRVLAYSEDLGSADLDHVLLERLGAQEVVLGLAGKRATRTERDLAERGRERGRGFRFGLEGERLLLGGLGGPLGTEKVGGEAGNVRRSHPVRPKIPLVRLYPTCQVSCVYAYCLEQETVQGRSEADSRSARDRVDGAVARVPDRTNVETGSKDVDTLAIVGEVGALVTDGGGTDGDGTLSGGGRVGAGVAVVVTGLWKSDGNVRSRLHARGRK